MLKLHKLRVLAGVERRLNTLLRMARTELGFYQNTSKTERQRDRLMAYLDRELSGKRGGK